MRFALCSWTHSGGTRIPSFILLHPIRRMAICQFLFYCRKVWRKAESLRWQLSCNTETVLLDEPVLGLDAYHRDLFYRELISSYSENPRTIVISTHLIEEAADIIEEVIILKEGQVILQDSVENVLKKGYTISGPIGRVDAFLPGKQVIGSDVIGGLKSAYLFDEMPESPVPDGLELSKLDLQKMFIHLTNS